MFQSKKYTDRTRSVCLFRHTALITLLLTAVASCPAPEPDELGVGGTGPAGTSSVVGSVTTGGTGGLGTGGAGGAGGGNAPFCGDGAINLPNEECDDGNLDDEDLCHNDCTHCEVTGTLWTATYNSPANGLDVAQAVAFDSGGNAIVVGSSFRGDLGQDDNATIRKYDPSGNLVWSLSRNNPEDTSEQFYAVAVDAADNIVVAGAEYRPGLGENINILVIKYDGDGKLIWSRSHDGPASGTDIGFGVAVDSQDNIVAVGQEGRTEQGSAASWQWVRKYDSGGVALWTDSFEGPDYDETNGDTVGRAVAFDANDNVVVIGDTFEFGFRKALIRKYASTGSLLWTVLYDSDVNNRAMGHGVAVDAAGNVIVTGIEERSSLERKNAFACKYDPDGLLTWCQTYNSPSNDADQGEAVAVDAAGNVYVAGLETRADLNQSINVLLLKYDKDGNPQWTWNFDSPSHGFDSALGLAVIPDGSAIAVAGLEQRLDLGQDGNLWVHVLGPCPN